MPACTVTNSALIETTADMADRSTRMVLSPLGQLKLLWPECGGVVQVVVHIVTTMYLFTYWYCNLGVVVSPLGRLSWPVWVPVGRDA